jgi:hypothetical protein
MTAAVKFTGKERDAETGLDYFGVWSENSNGLKCLTRPALHLVSSPAECPLLAANCATKHTADAVDSAPDTLRSGSEHTSGTEFPGWSRWPTTPARSGRVAVVVVQHAAQATPPPDSASRPKVARFRADDLVREALMIPLGVIVLHEVLNGRPQGRLAEEDHPVQAGLLDASDKSFRVRIQIG